MNRLSLRRGHQIAANINKLVMKTFVYDLLAIRTDQESGEEAIGEKMKTKQKCYWPDVYNDSNVTISELP